MAALRRHQEVSTTERRQIEHFLAVVEHGGFTAAAATLYISQPSLSHSIKMLERDLGALLFHRLPRGVRLTTAGEVFHNSARQILHDIEVARVQVQAVGDLVRGSLDLIAFPGLLLEPLAGAIGRFRDQHPGVVVSVRHAETTSEVRDAVSSGGAELGLSNDFDVADPQLSTYPLAEQEFKVLLPPGSPVPPDNVISREQLITMPVVTGPPGTEVRDLLTREARQVDREFLPVVEVGLRGGALYLVLAGAGAAVLPLSLAEVGRACGAVVVPLHPRWKRRAYLMHRNAPLSPAASAMLRTILADSPGPLQR